MEAEIALPALNRAHPGAMHSSDVGEFLLRPLLPGTQFANALSEGNQDPFEFVVPLHSFECWQ